MPEKVSTGLGRTTCAYFMPGDTSIIYASTHLKNVECPHIPERTDGKYVWPIYDSYDIFVADLNGKIIIPSLFEGRLIPRNAFWYTVGTKTLVYMTANSSATCELASNHLNPNETHQDPSDLFILDHCTNTGACRIFIYGAMGVKWTTLTFKQLAAQKNLRMDASYWLKRQASSRKRQAASNKQLDKD